MPKTSHSNPRSKGEEKAEGAPLPDRTRVEPSPFVPESPRTSRKSSAISDHTDPDLNKGSRKATGAQSIIVDEALDAVSEPAPKKPTSVRRAASLPPRRNGAAGDWDDAPAPSAEDANATRVSMIPERRPGRDDDSESTSAGPPYAVEVLAGPDKGIRLPIRGGRMIVGRGDGCDLKLTDTSVSRRHLEAHRRLRGPRRPRPGQRQRHQGQRQARGGDRRGPRRRGGAGRHGPAHHRPAQEG
ncbi:MAG: FHA domain-containing protein [Myxococcales bacterium]